MASDSNFDLLGLDGEGHAALGADFQACGDGFADVADSFLTGVALADATGNGRAFGDPNAILVPVQRGHELHNGNRVHQSFALGKQSEFAARGHEPVELHGLNRRLHPKPIQGIFCASMPLEIDLPSTQF